jgi:hypothetical protein
MTCISEYMSWPELSNDEKLRLGSVYAPYFALCWSSLESSLESANMNLNFSRIYECGHVFANQRVAIKSGTAKSKEAIRFSVINN